MISCSLCTHEERDGGCAQRTQPTRWPLLDEFRTLSVTQNVQELASDDKEEEIIIA